MSYQSTDMVYKGGPVTVEAEAESQPITDLIEINDCSNIVVDVIPSAIALANTITCTLQTKANEGPWVTHKSTNAAGAVSAVAVVTFEVQASTVAGDFIIFEDRAGLTWAAAADISGTDPEPTAPAWVAVNAARKVQVDLSGATTDAEVRDAFDSALQGLTDYIDTFLNTQAGTADLEISQKPAGSLEMPLTSSNAAGSGIATSFTITEEPGRLPSSITITLTQVGIIDEELLPMRPKARVVCTTGEGDSITISAVYVSRRLNV